MRHRIYTVRMPTDGATPVNIFIEGPFPAAIGAASAPVAVGADGFFAEWRNRPLLVPQKALLPNLSPNPSFTPFLRLGFRMSILQVVAISPPVEPTALLSRSLVGPVLTTAAGATTLGDGGSADFGATQQQPCIILLNTQGIAGRLYRVYFGVCQAKDDDRDDIGSV